MILDLNSMYSEKVRLGNPKSDFSSVRAFNLITFRFTQKIRISFYNCITFRFAGFTRNKKRGGDETFFFFSLLISFYLFTFAAVKQLVMTYQVNEVLQRIIEFFASFCTLSLVNPNNLLTHTHTHTHIRT